MNKKVVVVSSVIIISIIVGMILVGIIWTIYSPTPPPVEPKHFRGELEPYCINETRDIIIFYIRILENPDNVTGVYRPNLLDPNVTRRGYVLTVGDRNTTVYFPEHQYIDVQNDYTINTGDLLILYNRSNYIGMRVIITVPGLPASGDIIGRVV